MTREIEALAVTMDVFGELPVARLVAARADELLDVSEHDTVVDVGCGPGAAVASLSARGVRAIGVDVSPEMLEIAARRHPGCEFRVGSATELPLETGGMRGYRAEKVLHAVADPAAALAEAARVLAPGGRIVLVGQDWELLAADADDPVLTREVLAGAAAGMPSPRSARRFRNLLLDGGFTGVEVEVHTLLCTAASGAALLPAIAGGALRSGTVDPVALEGWLAEQERRIEADRFFAAVPLFVASADRP
ncbi:methyltransferase domain-containing protein [Amycolatopsis nigrescens]|uniref:methyltransferase domain-containing protein n=1 Tax=Amycolatopsis nigrescens TaxID=381445 RepID=UPI000364AEE1|nr:methyltransferase domain-containing protein [Amycolatopsis nigrescens]